MTEINDVIASLEPAQQAPVSYWSYAWRKLRRNPAGVTGIVILIALILVAVSAPVIAPFDPNEMNLRNALQPPGSEGHLL